MKMIETEVINCIRKIEEKKVHIDYNTTLYHDLGIAGDDMCELLVLLQKNFNTSFIKMDLNQYCPNETEVFSEHILRKMGFGKKWTPLTVNHLIQVVKSGSWFDP